MSQSWWQKLFAHKTTTIRKAGCRARKQQRTQPPLRLEELEDRRLLSGSATPQGFTPDQIRKLYGIDRISLGTEGIVGDGTGQGIAVIDAYDNPRFVNSNDPAFVTSDLHNFDLAFNLPDPPAFLKLDLQSYVPLPPAVDPTGRWAGETALDVEWAHVVAPRAKILLVEAIDGSDASLYDATELAAQTLGVSVVSMSFGRGETGDDPGLNANFVSPPGHPVTFLASAGDKGFPVEYPSVSPNVVAVGGTTMLTPNPNGTYAGEIGWSEPLPALAADDADTTGSYSQTGTWTTISGGAYGTYELASPLDGSTATWTISNLSGTDQTEVAVTWVPGPDRATNAQFLIFDGDTLIGTAPVNERNAPVGVTFQGRPFVTFGRWKFTSGTMKVVLNSAGADGNVVADAIGEADLQVPGSGAGGGGTSIYEPRPGYQDGVNTPDPSYRGTPDVAFLADANTGVAVYDSDTNGATTPWVEQGGTSLSAPCWAGLIAIADQGRALVGLPPLDGPTETLPTLYDLNNYDFHDITQGYNGYPAGPGYDSVTGRGTPIANLLVPDLAGLSGPLDFVAPDNAANDLTLRLDGANLEILDNGAVVASKALANTTSVTVVGADNTEDTLTIDYGPGEFTVPVTFDGGAGGSNTLALVDNVSNNWSITDADAGYVRPIFGAQVNFSNTQNLTGGSGTDTFTFSANGSISGTIDGGGATGANATDILDLKPLTAAVTWTLHDNTNGEVPGVVGSFKRMFVLDGSSGKDTFTLADTQVFAATINGDGDSDTLDLSAYRSALTWDITEPDGGSIHAGLGLLVVGEFQSVENLTGGSGDDTFTFNKLTALDGTLDGRGGFDKLDLSSFIFGLNWAIMPDTSGNIRTPGGLVVVNKFIGVDSLIGGSGNNTLDLSAFTSPLTWNLYGNDSGDVPGVISFKHMLTLDGSAGKDTFAVANGQLFAGTVNGDGDSDTLDLGTYLGALDWDITEPDGGFVIRPFFVGFLYVVGEYHSVEKLTSGSGDDTFTFSDGATVSDTLNAGGGSDKLDLSVYTTPLLWDVFGADHGDIHGVVPLFQSVENLTSGLGSDGFFVSPAGSATVTLDGNDPPSGPGDQLLYQGPGNIIPGATPDSGSINPPGFGAISFKRFERQGVVVTAGQFANDHSVDSFLTKTDGPNVKVFLNNGLLPEAVIPLASTVGLYLLGSGDDDNFLLDNSLGIAIPLGGLFVEGMDGNNNLTISDVAIAQDTSYAISPDSVRLARSLVGGASAASLVSFTGLSTLAIKAGSGANSVEIDNHAVADNINWTVEGHTVTAVTPSLTTTVSSSTYQDLTMQGGTATDRFMLAPVAQDLGTLPARMTVDGGGGASDFLMLNDEKHAKASTWTINGAVVTRTDNGGGHSPATASVTYSNIYYVEAHGGTRDDSFTVGPDSQHLQALPPRLTADGGGGNNNQLTVDYGVATDASQWFVDSAATEVARAVSGSLQNEFIYANLKRMELDAGSNNDSIDVLGTSMDTTVRGGAGVDTIRLGGPTVQSGNLDNVQGAVTVDGGDGVLDTLTMNDGRNANGSQWTIDPTQVQRVYTATDASGHPVTVNRRVKYSNVETVAVNAGTGPDTFDVGGSAQNLGALPPHVAIDGGGAAFDQASLNDQQATTATTWQVTGGKATRTMGAQISDISYNAVESVTVHGGQQDDAFTVARDAQGLDDLPQTVSLDGGAGSNNRLTVDDSGPAADAMSVGWAVSATEVDRTHGSHSAMITYARMNALAMNGGAAPDMIDVRATAVDTTIDAGDGADMITAGATNNNLDNLQAKLTVRGGPGADKLVANDRNNAQASTWTITAGEMDRTVATITRTISYSGVEAVEADAGSMPDNIAVASTSAPTTVRGGGGADAISVGAGTNSLDGIQGIVTVDGEADAAQLQVNDQANTKSANWVVTGSTVSRVNQAPAGSVPVTIQYANIGNLSLTTGSAGTFDNVGVRGTSAATTVNIVAGLDEIDVGNLANSLDDLHGPLTIPSAYILHVNDQGTSSAQSYTLTGSGVTRSSASGSASIGFGSAFAETVNGGSGGGVSNFAIQSTSAPQTVLVTGTGQDNVSIASNAANVALSVYDATGGVHDLVTLGNGTVAGLLGDILLASVVRHLTVDDRNDIMYRSFAIGDTSSTILSPTPLRYSALGMDFYLGSGGNDVDVLGANGGLLTVHGNTNVDNVTVKIANDLFAHTVRFEGQAADMLTIDDSARTTGYRYTVTDSAISRVRTTVQYVGVGSVKLLGTGGDDVFQIVSTPATIPLTVLGGAGNNTLDYSAYPSGVLVDLATGTATGLAGIGNIANVIGSAFDDVLVGDAGSNTLTGGAGRDMVIGGLGADQLDGGAGDDILVGGSTIYDANTTALLAILQEWTRTDLAFSVRVDHLRNGGGLNDPYRLNASTVIDDGVADALTGGLGQDWFWVNPSQDSRDTHPEDQEN
jgi:hypothetical protein